MKIYVTIGCTTSKLLIVCIAECRLKKGKLLQARRKKNPAPLWKGYMKDFMRHE